LPSDKLTELGVRKAKPSSKPKKLSDGGGLFLLLHPNGSKYWRMKYRFMGKEKLLAIGVWPEVSLIAAREKRNEAKQLLKSGKDPSAAKKNLKLNKRVAQSNTFGLVTEEWLEVKQKEWKSPYFDDVRSSIEIHLLPDLGQRPIEDITSSEILSVLKKIEEQGKLEVASRSRQKCGAIFTYANLKQLCTNNPDYVPAKNNLKIVKIDKNKSLFNYEKKILIKDLTLGLKLGYYDFEKNKPQKVKFTLEVDYRDKKPTNDKDLKSIVNYDKIVKLIKKLVKNKHYNFLETLAEDVFDELFKDKRIDKITLQIEKLEIMKDCSSVGIQISKKRSHEKL